MLQEKLKEDTQKNHDILEQLMFVQQIMSGALTLQQYKLILTTNYLVHRRFEDTLYQQLSPAVTAELDITHRHKLDALVADMEQLNMIIPQPQNNTPLGFYTEAGALGAMYVLEGATLGGNVIVKRLKANPQLNTLGLGFNYYQVYGENLMPYWKKFCEVLNKQPEETHAESIAGAEIMFEYIADVQRQNNVVNADKSHFNAIMPK